jgi:hypothetical protein
MKIAAYIAKRIPEIHKLVIDSNPEAGFLLKSNTDMLSALVNPVSDTIAYLSFIAMIGLTLWQIHRAIKITRLR